MLLNFSEVYYTDPYCAKIKTEISWIVPAYEFAARGENRLKGWYVLLTRTNFFPGGGGQPADRGWLCFDDKKIKILAAESVRLGRDNCSTDSRCSYDRDNAPANGSDCEKLDPAENDLTTAYLLPHSFLTELGVTSEKSLLGRAVDLEIDWQRRYDFMQQHSAEHLFSGLAKREFGCDNVGFHLSETVMTMDLNKNLGEKDLQKLERAANAIVWERRATKATVYPSVDVIEIDFRQKKALPGKVRILEIPGADCCACCGLHVANTVEIGMVKVLSAEKHRGGIRVFLAAGQRLYDHLSREHEILAEICRQYSANLTNLKDKLAAVAIKGETAEKQLVQIKERELETLAQVSRRQAVAVLRAAAAEARSVVGETTNEVVNEKPRIFLLTRRGSGGSCGAAVILPTGVAPGDLRRAINIFSAAGFEFVLAGCHPDAQTLVYSIAGGNGDATAKIDFTEWQKVLKRRFDAKGGGRADYVQGQILWQQLAMNRSAGDGVGEFSATAANAATAAGRGAVEQKKSPYTELWEALSLELIGII